MQFEDLIREIRRFGSSAEDACKRILGVLPDSVEERVILAPWWEPEIFDSFDEIRQLSVSESHAVKVWSVKHAGLFATYIKTGIGAAVLMDVVLALGISRCRKIIFTGSAGALDNSIDIGDIVIPEFSVCGDGASRYLAGDKLAEDAFLKKAFPSVELTQMLRCSAEKICQTGQVGLHSGRVYSVDTIFAQFAYIDEIIGLGCNIIEMETAAAFRAAALAGIEITALFSVSDNIIRKKSLMSGRESEEIAYRKRVRRELFPQIIWDVFEEDMRKEK